MSELAPDSIEDLSRAVREAHQAEHKVQITGASTKLSWGNPLRRCDQVISVRRLGRVLEHAWADMTVTVEAGCRISELQRVLAERKQRLALDPLWPECATVGGVLATNDSGVLRLRYGSARDLLIGVTLVLADGTVTKSGGKVVKNVAGYDLPKLVVGSFGTLGVVAQVVFRLHPLPECRRSLALRFREQHAAQAFVLAVQAEPLAHSALQLRSSSGSGCSVEVLLEGTPAGIEAQAEALQRLAGSSAVGEADERVWQARTELWDGPDTDAVIKVSVLPNDLAHTAQALEAAGSGAVDCVFQATGLGYARLQLGAHALHALRQDIEALGGSLALLRRPEALRACEAFGSVSALRVMRALKQQFDPKHTLNPGRFVGGL